MLDILRKEEIDCLLDEDKGKKMKKFDEKYVECPKCKTLKRWNVRFEDELTVGALDKPLYDSLKWTCEVCGFHYYTHPADYKEVIQK